MLMYERVPHSTYITPLRFSTLSPRPTKLPIFKVVCRCTLLTGATQGRARTSRSASARKPQPKVSLTTLYDETFIGTIFVLCAGFDSHVVTLDSIESKIPTDGPVIIITASYEGEPADNAGRFVEALKHIGKGDLANVRFAVFGCGHHDWVQTFQRIPTLVDNRIAECGGQRLLERAAADSGADEFFDYVREMMEHSLFYYYVDIYIF